MADPQHRYRFGDYELDSRTRELRRGGKLLLVEPKPLELLLLLVRNAGELVSKNELMDTVWAGRIVTEAVIARAVTKLRRALDDGAQTLILTVHGYGYRFTGAVCIADEAADERPRAAAASAIGAEPLLLADAQPPLRLNWQLLHPLDAHGKVWLGGQVKTGEQRVFKFARTPQETDNLKRELTLYRLLRKALPESRDFVRLLDYNLEQAPYFLELDYEAAGSLGDWLASLGGAAQLPLADRLSLFADAASSLAAAHSVGVVHQDVKPSNLLVVATETAPRLRWTDFGSGHVDAATLEQWRVTRLASGEAEQVSSSQGTPLYLAPERLKGQPASVKGDVYALGVLLYQLVVADLTRPLAPGWEREVSDPLLRADIAAAADTDPAHRLGDAGGLARRIQQLPQRRALAEHEAGQLARQLALQRDLIEARRRRRWLTGALATSLVLLVITGVYQWRLTHEKARSETARATAESLNQFLVEDLLTAADPYKAGGGAHVTVASVLDAAMQTVDSRFATQAKVRAALYENLGDSYRSLNLYEQAIEAHRRGIEAAFTAEGKTSVMRARMIIMQAMALIETERPDEATAQLKALRDDLAEARSHELVMLRANALHTLGWATLDLGQPVESERQLRQALADFEPPEDEHEQYSIDDTRWDLAETLLMLGGWQEAEQLIESVYANYSKNSRVGAAHLGWVNITRAKLYIETEQWARAEAVIDEMDRIAGSLPPDHRIGLLARFARVRLALVQGQTEQAAALAQALLPVMVRAVGDQHDFTFATHCALVEARLQQGAWGAARAEMTPLLQRITRFAHGDPRRWRALNLEQSLRLAEGAPAETVLTAMAPLLAEARKREHPHCPQLAELLLTQSQALSTLGQTAPSALARQQATTLLTRHYGAAHQRVRALNSATGHAVAARR